MSRQSGPLDAARWAALMQRLGIGPNRETFERLQAAYAERHRHYHTAEHINQCLGTFDEVRHLARAPDEVELGLWFHDAVYATRAKDNEARSAQWAKEFLADSGVAAAPVRRVHDLVMATAHAAIAADPDAALLTDVDLSILGADRETYERFERNVRKEYWWVPGFKFRQTRAGILQSFLDRPAVFATRHFRDRLEEPARRNLALAISALTEGG
jgi:predicted metal-dependent HD superfamily phosphohydrolase